VYKRALDMAYNLKIKSSRAVYGEVRSTHAAAAAAACGGSPVLSWAACSRCCALFRSFVSCGVVAGHVALCQLGCCCTYRQSPVLALQQDAVFSAPLHLRNMR
jgi:hypothetical protein